MPTTGERFERAVSIMARLRGPGGCPWDREQTFDSIKPYTLEETYEVLEAIDNRDWDELSSELGDLLLQVLFYAQMAHEETTFSIDQVLDRLSQKLVDRHPHVFGAVKAETSSEVLRNWQQLKAEEKKRRVEAGGGKKGTDGEDENHSQSVLAGVSTAIPALLEAYKLSSRAAHVGFDWPNVEGLFEKLHEETQELQKELEQVPAPGPLPQASGGSRGGPIPQNLRARLEAEVGDLFFVLVNIARYLSLDPESALRKTNRKFKRRFSMDRGTVTGFRTRPGAEHHGRTRIIMATGEATGARVTLTADAVVIRLCHDLEEMRACVALQKEVWNFSDADLIPLRMFVVAEKIGGQIIAAFDGREVVGFGLSIPGYRDGRSYLHSHMLAVLQNYRNLGLGRRIKLFQRDEALARGFELIEWTFDPLEIKNAYLNIEKLGAIARRYNVNQYGITSSPLQGGLPTDRLVAEWWLKSKRVENILKGKNYPFQPVKDISIPAQIYDWKAATTTRERAKEIQDRTRDEFLKAFADGLAVLGYERDEKGNGKFLLARCEEESSGQLAVDSCQ